MTIEDLKAKLQNVHERGSSYTASCPCRQNHKNGDRNESLSFKLDPNSGKILIYCHTGCRIDEICAALGCTTADLMPDKDLNSRDSLLKWYANKNGFSLEKVYSYDYGKYHDGLAKARFRKPDGKKSFAWIKSDSSKRNGVSMGHDGCPNRLYMRGDLKDPYVFLVEGEKDADNLHNLTGWTTASAENGAKDHDKDPGKKWLAEYTQQLSGSFVYILFDNDAAGRNFAQIEAAALQDHAAAVFLVDLCAVWPECPEKGDISDMIEALGDDESKKRLDAALNLCTEYEPNQDEPKTEPAEQSPVDLFDDFMQKIQTEAYKPMKTGMPAFDQLLGGGILPQSLVILSAAPGTGKTSLAQQIFEAAAADGTHVIFLNLEMSREQLLARSMSRIMHRQGHSMSAAEILKGYVWKNNPARAAEVNQAAAEYKKRIAGQMHYNPPGCTTDINSIADTLDTAGRKAQEAGKPGPVCVLDYLHLVTSDRKEESAEIIKKAITILKDYAIRYNTFVLAISANNRTANSSGSITLESGRDTSGIEYGADYQLALNYRALHERSEIEVIRDGVQCYEKASASNPDHMEALQKTNPRKMLVQVLKSRMNAPGGKLYLSFDAANSVFIPEDTTRTAPAAGGMLVSGFREITTPDPDNPFL